MRIQIYDDQCRLCVTAKEGLERVGEERDVRFVPYQSEEAAGLLGATHTTGRPDVAFLVAEDGAVTRGLDAFLPLALGLRGGRVLHAIFTAPMIRPLADLAYRLLARYRYKLFGAVTTRPSSGTARRAGSSRRA